MENSISGKTRVAGIIGHSVAHTFSPAMHNAAFAALGLDWVYVPFDTPPEQLAAAVAGIKALGLVGVNVTVPHKEKIIPLLDELTPEAELIGAVNTVLNREGRLIGDNTDSRGFLHALLVQTGFEPAGKTVLILGAGGAARAIAVGLALGGAKEIVITNRTRAGGEALRALLESRFDVGVQVIAWPDSGSRFPLPGTDLTVQTTPVGMYPKATEATPLPLAPWYPGQIVCDLIYNPQETWFLSCARNAGATVQNGLGMLLYQGALSFSLWTGLPAPVTVMEQVLSEQVKSEG